MDDDAPHRMRWPRVFARVGGYTLLAVVLYVLSFGPASYVFYDRSDRLDRAVGQVYAPIYRLYGNTGIKSLLPEYERWWSSLPGGPDDRWHARQRNLMQP